jgi:short-subunit dehydrogenase
MTRSERKVVVVTGASSGIGRGVARALSTRGDHVVLAARGRQALDEVGAECRRAGGSAVAVPTDVSDESALEELVRRAVAEFGRVDAWVNSAAVWSYGRFEDTLAEVFRQIVDTTLFGQIHAARAVLPHFRSQGHGVLVNIASLYGRVSSPYVAPYVTSKWGLLGFSEVLRQELRDAPGIKVCAILPGAVDTPIYRHAANYVGRDIRPLPPVISPERVVSAVVRAVDRPKAQVIVGRTHHLGAWAHQLMPGLYDRLVGPIVDVAALQRTSRDAHDGNVFVADSDSNGVDDGWRRHDHRRIGQVAGVAAGAVIAAKVAGRGSRSSR